MKRKPFPKKFRPNVDRGQVWRAADGAYIWITGAVYDDKKCRFRTDAFYALDMERGHQYIVGLDGLPWTKPNAGGLECYAINDAGKVTREYAVRLTMYLGAMEPPRFVGNLEAHQVANWRTNLRHVDAIQNLANWHGHVDAAARTPGAIAEFENYYKSALVDEHNEREDKRITILMQKGLTNGK